MPKLEKKMTQADMIRSAIDAGVTNLAECQKHIFAKYNREVSSKSLYYKLRKRHREDGADKNKKGTAALKSQPAVITAEVPELPLWTAAVKSATVKETDHSSVCVSNTVMLAVADVIGRLVKEHGLAAVVQATELARCFMGNPAKVDVSIFLK